jgi:hypothetical protein
MPHHHQSTRHHGGPPHRFHSRHRIRPLVGLLSLARVLLAIDDNLGPALAPVIFFDHIHDAWDVLLCGVSKSLSAIRWPNYLGEGVVLRFRIPTRIACLEDESQYRSSVMIMERVGGKAGTGGEKRCSRDKKID